MTCDMCDTYKTVMRYFALAYSYSQHTKQMHTHTHTQFTEKLHGAFLAHS